MTTRIKPVHGIGDHIRRRGADARCNTATKNRSKAAACTKTLVRCSAGSGRISSATSHNEEKAKKHPPISQKRKYPPGRSLRNRRKRTNKRREAVASKNAIPSNP